SSVSLDPPSPTTASTNNSILNVAQSNGTNSTTSGGGPGGSRMTPSPKPSSKLERELDYAGTTTTASTGPSGSSNAHPPPPTAPLRLPDGLSRGGVGSFMREFHRELGLNSPGADDVDPASRSVGAAAGGGGPPMGPLPDLPAGRMNVRRNASPASVGTGPGTPPPAYMSAR
ncbi:hypothetical protein FRB90_006207, partial [Tulasnella sp. 427]